MSLNFPSSDTASLASQPLSQGYWVRLTDQMDRLQASLDDVLAETQASGSQVEALLGHLTDPARSQAFDERLAGLLAGQEMGQEQWQTLSSDLNDLAQTVAKLNRTQFKSNALAEMKDQHVATALGTLQDVAVRREQLQEARTSVEQERMVALRVEARGEFAADLLPALDGLEMALLSGRGLLERRRRQEVEAACSAQTQSAIPEPPPVRPGLWQRLAWALWGRGLPPGALPPGAPATPPVRDDVADAVTAWLQGLELVRTRFLGLLATADIYPIQAEGRPFDPRLHLAMETESRAELPDGAVVNVLRKGYRQRGRVLRYAEVTVNRVAGTEAEAPTGDAVGSASEIPGEDEPQQDMITESKQP
jgi:molecular chaperone GrpE (heat shock protein)